MNTPEDILPAADAYVQAYLQEHLPSSFLFHNYEHAIEVVEVCKKLAKAAALDKKKKDYLLLAAWFQDTGYTKGEENHEANSVNIAQAFLEKQGWTAENIKVVEQLIMSTKKGAALATDLEKILYDANWSFLGRKRFFDRSKLLRLEIEQLQNSRFSAKGWNKFLLDLQLETGYKTPWGQSFYLSRKRKNLSVQAENHRKAKEKTVRNKTGKNFGRGIDTLYRITLRNHLNLSSIADGKANMIISINTLVLSILITAGTALFSMGDQGMIQWNIIIIAPIGILMLSSLAAIVFAILSAMPKVEGARFTMEEVKNHKVSLLFFGNFLQLDRNAYVQFLRNLKKDQELIYDDLSRDLYNLGQILQKKYRLLTIAYRIFMAGLLLSVLVFVLFYFLF
ncbi:MAG: DUF5706 domain-containing protein [Saprospiraceae bacterium]